MSDIFDTCKRCGWRHFIGTDGLCPDCRRDDHARMELEDGETEFTGEDAIRCPWCAKRVPMEPILHDGSSSGDYTCPYCGKQYHLDVNLYYTYDTRRVET